MFNCTKKCTSNRLHLVLLSTLLACGLFAAGCGNDLNEAKNDNNPAQNSNHNKNNVDNNHSDKTYPNITHKKSSQGFTTTTINSTSLDKWIYLQLSTGEETSVTDPSTADNWDLAFQRFSILVNGGVSGPANVEITHLNGVKFEDVTQAPTENYHTDVDGVPDERGQNPGLAFLADDAWYDYDGTKHVLNIRDRVYIIHASTGEYFKMQFLDYYDQAGTGGFIQFNWQEIDAPEGSGYSDFKVLTNTIDVTNEEEFVYLDVATNAEVVVADPETSVNWDLAFQKTTVRLNAAGNIAIAHVDGVPFADVTDQSATDFRTDEGEAGAAFKTDGNWYAYDMTTHTLTTRDRVYLVQKTSGDVFKIQLVSYYDQDNTPGYITVKSQQIK